ncbi:MAG: class I SAM-dependent methyltransferase [Candidatus Heimdallarchaeaceae archaeon]
MQKDCLKLNLGCGKRLLDGYENIDNSPFLQDVVKDSQIVLKMMDVRNLMYPDESVDEILAEFVLEHVPYFEVQETVWEWWRTLKIGGILNLLVPDFEEIAKAYLAGKLTRDCLHFQLYSPVLNPERQMPHLCTFSKSYLRQLLIEEGFSIESMKNIGTDVRVIGVKTGTKENLLR